MSTESNKEILLKLVDYNKEVSNKLLDLSLEFSNFKNEQDLKWQKMESYLESNPKTKQEGAIEKIDRIENKLTEIDKKLAVKSITIAGITSVIAWVITKIVV